MNINLKVWRQQSGTKKGSTKTYRLENIDPNISFLEMLDVLNIKLVKEKKDPVAFDHDCREGICGSCGFMINGQPHGPQKATTVCQLHMRAFKNEDEINKLFDSEKICMTFVDSSGYQTEQYPLNPNKSPSGITGITNNNGNITIMMPHPERVFRSHQFSWKPLSWGEYSPWMQIFINAKRFVS